jgi:hypothetical protein
MRPPQQRRGPVVTHDWVSICGEIARRCIELATGIEFLVVFPPSACRIYDARRIQARRHERAR